MQQVNLNLAWQLANQIITTHNIPLLLLFIIMMRFFIFLSIASLASPFQAQLSVVRQSRRNIIISAATQNGSSDETKMSNVDEYRNAPTVSMCVYTYIYCLLTTLHIYMFKIYNIHLDHAHVCTCISCL